MIIQCEQCNTRFRLDDAKIRGRGVKVRCSKCRHVFLVQKEEQPEETAFEGQYGEIGAAFGGVAVSAPADAATGLPVDTPAFSPPAVTPVVAETEEEDGVAATQQATSAGEEQASLAASEADNVLFDSDSGVQPDSSFLPDEPAGFDFGHDLDGADLSQQLETPSAEGGVGAQVETADDTSFDIAPQLNTGAESATEEFSIDFGEMNFSEESVADKVAAADGKAPVRDDFNLDFDDVFGEIPSIPGSASSAAALIPDDGALSSVSAPSDVLGGEDLGGLDFGELDLGELTPGSQPAATDVAQGHEVFSKADVAAPAPSATPAFTATAPAEDNEELPPLTISSRRKGASFFPAAITIIAIFFVVILAGIGFFVVSGPETMKKVGLDFLTNLTGGAPEEGKISLGKVSAEFVTNNEAGELFVIRGETINNYSKPRASIQVKATLLAANGQPILNKLAYCGNSLTKDQLTMLPPGKLEEVMNNQFGDSLSNMGVQPGKSIPFVVVFTGAPKEAVDFTVSVAGSTVAAK